MLMAALTPGCLAAPPFLKAQPVLEGTEATAEVHGSGNGAYPELSWRREAVLTGVGTGLLVTGLLLSPDPRVVPAEGLDPAEISWSVDPRSLGTLDVSAKDASDWTRNAAIVFPVALALFLGEPGHRVG